MGFVFERLEVRQLSQQGSVRQRNFGLMWGLGEMGTGVILIQAVFLPEVTGEFLN